MTKPSNKDAKGPILAKKGSAQPLTPPADAKREKAQSEDPGLGQRPRQGSPAPEATPEQPDEPGPNGEDEVAARARPGLAREDAPAATMLDHPLRLPKSVVFEDQPKGPNTPVQSTPATSTGDARPAIGGEQLHDPGEAPGSEDAEATPGESEAEAQRRRADLASWAQEGRKSEKSGRKHWPVAVGALVCAIALVALVESGIAPLGNKERESSQSAEQTQGAPSSESGTTATAKGETGPAAPGEAPILAVLPDPQVLADLERDPVVDFIRLNPEDKAVVAGRAVPGTEVVILDNGAQLGRATADIYGLWTFVSDAPLSSGRHNIALALESEGTLTLLPGPGPAVATPEPKRPAEPAEETDIEVAAGPAVTSPPADEIAAAAPTEPAPEAVETPAPAVPQAPTAPQVAAAAATGSFAVQLASLSTPNAAQRAQGDLEKRFPDLLAGLEMFIDRSTLDDGRVVYRVRTGLFGSRADAAAVCARFKAREQDCLAVRR